MRGLLVMFLIACGDREKPPGPVARPIEAGVAADELTAAERAELVKHKRVPLRPDRTNQHADSRAAARLGRKLFFEPTLSGPLLIDSELGKAGDRGKVSCHTCHDGPAMDDRGAHLSIGTGRGSRNSPPLVGAAHYTWSNWGGRFDSQWSLSLGVIEKPEVMNGSRVDVARLIIERYPEDYVAAFGEPVPATLDPKRFPPGARPKEAAWDRMAADDRALVDRVYVHVAKALAAYLRTLDGKDAPFDRFVAGDEAAINAAAKRGFKLFLEHCKVCHAGPQFTDDKFHALAVAQFGPDVPPEDRGWFDDAPGLLASPYHADGEASDDRTLRRRDELSARTPVYREVTTPPQRKHEQTPPHKHEG